VVARTRKLRITALAEFEWVAVAGVAGRRGTYYPRRRLGVSTDVVAVRILILIRSTLLVAFNRVEEVFGIFVGTS